MWPIFVVNGPNQKQVSCNHYHDKRFRSIAFQMRLHETCQVNKNTS